MKVAARFPIKPNQWLIYLIFLAHIMVFLGGLLLLNEFWYSFVVFLVSGVSFYYARSQYLRITNSPDDLCWSGESWVMHNFESEAAVSYLNLLPTSWITASFCLLKFAQSEQSNAWFFSRKSLGERLYRELCYLAKADMNKSTDL